MKTFREFIQEDNIAGDGGVFGAGQSFGHGGSFGNTDFYNAGSAIIPYHLGTYRRNIKTKKNKRRKKRKSR